MGIKIGLKGCEESISEKLFRKMLRKLRFWYGKCLIPFSTKVVNASLKSPMLERVKKKEDPTFKNPYPEPNYKDSEPYDFYQIC